jgi:hypothetical protein
VLPLGFWMPIAIILISTAEKMEMKDAIDMNDTFFKVLGRSKSQNITNPMTAHTTVHVALSVTVLRQMVHVRMWLAMVKIRKIVCAPPKTSRPMAPIFRGLNRISPASAKDTTWSIVSDFAAQDWEHVAAYPRILHPKLSNDPSSVGRDNPESDNQNKSRHKTNSSEY